MTKAGLRSRIGENIRSERQARNMSIDELAELLELTPGFVGLIERGRRGATAYTLYKLSDIFAIPVDSIFTNTQKQPSERISEEKKPNGITSRRLKIACMIYDFTEAELDFIICMIQNIKTMSFNFSASRKSGNPKN